MGGTTIEIDDDLVTAAMDAFNVRTGREAVDIALRRALGTPLSKEFLLSLRGMGWGGDLGEMRGPGSPIPRSRNDEDTEDTSGRHIRPDHVSPQSVRRSLRPTSSFAPSSDPEPIRRRPNLRSPSSFAARRALQSSVAASSSQRASDYSPSIHEPTITSSPRSTARPALTGRRSENTSTVRLQPSRSESAGPVHCDRDFDQLAEVYPRLKVQRHDLA
ncbi:type II toxin-antitoxin system VapB family antitoxin [Nocardiopsis chromatogenes]|uniref:type II toxin-antitoxin system VapB family antitoxin n=1 Tax=Nocardiopsis chromatogenes TaxID=280239 RepID=UPI0023AA1D21|nr:type II toxin-antitoxin system VapB family antitoxin [Nocardiopsis chromatogenes]